MKTRLLFASLFLLAQPSLVCADTVSCGNEGQLEPADPCLSGVGANPINPLMGNLHREVTDLRTFGFAPISFTRIYNSRTTNFNAAYCDFGYKQTWQHNWNYEVRDLSSKTHNIKDVKVRYPDGSEYNFKASDSTGAVRVPTAEKGDRLYPWTGSPVGFTLVSPDGMELDFQRNGSPKYRLVQARDGHGVAYAFTYDTHGRLQRISNPFGRWIEIERAVVDGVLCIVKVSSHDGREVSYDYAEWTPTNSIALSAVHYPGGETASYTYVGASTPTTGRPLLASASDPMYGGAGARVRYIYNYDMTFDFGGGPYLVTGVAKEERSLATDALIVSLPVGTGEDVPVVEGSGAEIRRRFANGLIVEQMDGEGNATTYSRDAGGYGYIVATTDARGATTSFTRDFAGRVTAETDPLGAVTQTTYNAAGFVVATIDALGRVTTTTRDVHNQPTRVDHPDGSYEEWTYNSFGQPLTHRRADGGVVFYAYYGASEAGGFPQDLKSETDALGHVSTYTHTAAGLVASATDKRGFTTSFAYDWRGQTLQTTYADGSVTNEAWDEWGNRVAEIDELGQVTAYTFTGFNQVASIVDPFGRVTLYEYGVQPGCGGCSYLPTLARETRPSGRQITHAYDLRGKRVSTTEAAGTALAATTTFSYDSAGNLVSTTDPLGRTTTATFDLAGRRVALANALGETTSWTYDAAGHVLVETRPGGASWTFDYDVMGRAFRETDPLGGITERTYDAAGRVTQIEDPLGRIVTTGYDLEGRPISVGNADGTAQTFAYDASGNLIARTDELGGQTLAVYDARGRPISKTDALGRTTTTLYDIAGRVIAEVSPAGRRVEYSYDETNRRIAVTIGADTPDASAIDFTYDADGQLTSVTDAEGIAELYVYDALGRRISSIDALLRATHYSYDAAGNLVATIRPDGSVIARAYDALNRIVTETDAGGRAIHYTYNSTGQLSSIVDARGSVTSMAYDAGGRMIEKTYADGNGDDFVYDAAGQLVRHVTARGIQRDYTYTLRGQVDTVAYSDGTPATSSTYDGKGRLATQTRGTTTATYTYDAAGQLLSETQSIVGHPLGARSLAYAYDPDGLRSALTYPDGSVLEYAYNPRGQLTQLARDSAVLAAYSYRLNGALARRDLGNGTAEVRSYDAANQLVELANTRPDSTVLAKAGYSLNALGQRAAIERGSGVVESYTYNASGEVIAGVYGPGEESAYAFDAMGNRVTATETRAGTAALTSYLANELNQYTEVAAATVDVPTYDTDGNMTAASGRILAYDGQQQLVSIAPLAPAPGDLRLFHHYDARQRRIRQIEETYQPNGTWSPTKTTYYTYDGWNVIEEATVGESARRYTWGDDLSGSPQGAGGVGGLILAESTTDTWWYHYDGNGNVVALTDAAASEVASYRYSAFGEAIESTGPAAEENRYRFSTKSTDSCGFYLYGYRFYSEAEGRWISRDPIGNVGGANLYSMVSNDAISQFDVLGLFEETGHFYTTYIVARMNGLIHADARTLAYWSQYPDETEAFDAIGSLKIGLRDANDKIVYGIYNSNRNLQQFAKRIQESLHSLHGGDVRRRRALLKCILMNVQLEPWEKGLLIHAYGDSYAHTRFDSPGTAYSYPLGHLEDMHRPDHIRDHYDVYFEYAHNLSDVFGGANISSLLIETRPVNRITTGPGRNRVFRFDRYGNSYTSSRELALLRNFRFRDQNGRLTSYANEEGVHGYYPVPGLKNPSLGALTYDDVESLLKRIEGASDCGCD